MSELASRECWSAEQMVAIRNQLDRLLASALLRHGPRQQRLLRHIVEATLAGADDRLKGFTLGVEVFDRGADFDPNTDPIVRVEVGRLRSKLLEFYSGEGAADPVVIELPKGAYAARIIFRPASTGAISEQALRREPVRERPSIAVIPFANLSADPEQEYFADGITEDLITDLSKLSGLFVISRHSSFIYKKVTKRIEEIGAELGVRYLLEGSVRRSGETLRITAQLVEARSGDHVWAQRYDRPLRDIFAVQDDVTQKIVAALAVNLTPLEAARIGHEGTTSLEAHDTLLRGLERFWVYTETSCAEAQALFQRAVYLDPHYAAARAWLARSLVFRYSMRWPGTTAETLALAHEHIRTAVELDGLLPFAHAVRSWTELWARDGPTAVAAGRRAIALDPNSADARLFLSLSLSATGNGAEGLRQIEAGMRLNPQPSAVQLWARGVSLSVQGQDEAALADYREGIRLRAAFLPNLVWATWACVESGRMSEAHRHRDATIALTGKTAYPLRTFWLDPALDRRFQDALLEAGFTPRPDEE